MVGPAKLEATRETIGRRVMFALDFADPVTGETVADGIDVTAEGVGKPVLAPSGMFVWFDRDPPALRQVAVRAIARDRRFVDFAETLTIPAHVGPVKAADLRFTRRLVATGLYRPRPGTTGASGMLVEDEGPPLGVVVVGASISLMLLDAFDQPITSGYVATTDRRGGFVAVLNDLGQTKPKPGGPGSGEMIAWLKISRGSTTRYTAQLPIRRGRIHTVQEPIGWASLATQPPP